MNIEYVDHLGSDTYVVDAARVSFAKTAENYSDEANEKLIRYLADHSHWTPFAHCQVTFRIQMPIYIARQHFKHIVGSVKNETSRRYVQSRPTFYWPEWQAAPTDGVKQGSGGSANCAVKAEADMHLASIIDKCRSTYDALLSLGVAPEQARCVLPLNLMTEFIDTGSLIYWARVYNQRSGNFGHPQSEWWHWCTLLNEKMQELFPVSWRALTDDSVDA